MHLFMSLPQGDCHSVRGEEKKVEAILPWEDAVVSIALTEPDGALIYSNRFRLGSVKWKFSQGDLKLKPWRHADRIFGWFAWGELKGLKQALGTKSDYDAVISVERPSLRKRDFVQFRGE